MVLIAINAFYDAFTVSDLKNKCPIVSIDMIRKILKDLSKKGKVHCIGRGPNAQWKKTGNW
ncbi:MAG: hypothetical protein GY940_44575 [bacterium]|nr:hypothetical protein [bacterium]